MAPSHISATKMRNLLFVVALGLLAVVHSTPVNNVNQDDIYREAETDGYLVDNHLKTSVTTQSPKRILTSQASQQPSSESEKSETIEGSGAGDNDESMTSVFHQHGGKHLTTTTLSAKLLSHAQSSTSKVLRRHTDDSSVPDVIVSIFDSLESGFGSGDKGIYNEEIQYDVSVNTKMGTSTSTTAHIRHNTPQSFEENEGSGSDSFIEEVITRTVQEPQVKENVMLASPQNNTAHSTPGWIIIVGFIVGVAALVMLCVAIATRDKWNGPKHVSQLETKTNPSNQQMELEMETFLHKDKPKENGKAAEYTVIPLDELPEKCSAQ
ncbi:uncharacterized protein LOC121604577 [Chelmon rostratus]|uniref:uncharacterized protein LOC121604577 n=1 Tax=Chelmon rostratus TaxID=109905 RepID=UPI001BEBA63F|nr:uncharacterized protein LOC121604577 [Chelmon rostratus]